jgi:hypothetical protein
MLDFIVRQVHNYPNSAFAIERFKIQLAECRITQTFSSPMAKVSFGKLFPSKENE